MGDLRRHGRTLGRLLVGLGAVAAGVGVVALQPLGVVAPTRDGVVLLCLGLALGALGGTTLWWSLLALGGERHRWLEIAGAWWGGTPAKYLPGKVGSIVARTALLGEVRPIHGVTATAEVLLTTAAGALLALSLPVVSSPAATGGVGVTVALLGIALVAIARRWTGAGSTPVAPFPFAAAVAALSATWLGQGLALVGAVVAVGGEADGADLVRCSAIAGAGAVAGLLSPTPAGLGARDAVLAVLLADLIDGDSAGAAVVVWRVASVAVEVSLAGVAILATRRRMTRVP